MYEAWQDVAKVAKERDFKIVLKFKVPSWSVAQNMVLVKHGISKVMSNNDYGPLGLFQAETMAKVLMEQGRATLNQVSEDLDPLAINTKTAELVGFKVPHRIFQISDRVLGKVEEA